MHLCNTWIIKIAMLLAGLSLVCYSNRIWKIPLVNKVLMFTALGMLACE